VPCYLVETYLGRGNARERLVLERRVRTTLAARGTDRTPVRLERSIHIPDDELCFYVFEAASAEEAALVAETAGLDTLRIVEAISSREGEQ
jgi:hypothetical protein